VTLDEFAADVREIAQHAEMDLAMDACQTGSRAFLAVLRAVTPKRSGRLAASETVTGPFGSGARATAQVGPHCVYAEMENDGGEISAHPGKGRKGKGRHTLHFEETFALRVHHKGSHYMEKADALGRAVVAAAVAKIAAEFLGKL